MEPEEKGQEGPPKKDSRVWIGNEEHGRDWQIVESGGKKYLKRGDQWGPEIRKDEYGEVEIDGAQVERWKGKITKIDGQEVSGDFESLLP